MNYYRMNILIIYFYNVFILVLNLNVILALKTIFIALLEKL